MPIHLKTFQLTSACTGSRSAFRYTPPIPGFVTITNMIHIRLARLIPYVKKKIQNTLVNYFNAM